MDHDEDEELNDKPNNDNDGYIKIPDDKDEELDEEPNDDNDGYIKIP